MKIEVTMKKYIIIILTLFLISCQENIKEKRSLFSWNSKDIVNEDSQLFSIMKQYSINTLYQSFDKDNYEYFFKQCQQKNIQVYDLCGDKKFALKKNYQALENEINESLSLKKTYPLLKGIVLDIEPYLLIDWKDNQNQILQEFLDNLKKVYKICQDQQYTMIVCIPYYYDTLHHNNFLKTLIQSCCDGIAIMNYYKKDESQHIQYEVKLTKTYHKQCIVIYEMNKPYKDGITEMNTYYHDGINKAIESFEKIKKDHGINMMMSFHDYHALCDIDYNKQRGNDHAISYRLS